MAAANSNQVLLLWADPAERTALSEVLLESGAQVELGSDDSQVAQAHRLVIFDFDSFRHSAPDFFQAMGALPKPPAALVVIGKHSPQDLVELLSRDVLTNLVVKNTGFNADELAVTVQKIIRNDIFGLEKHFGADVTVSEETIRSSRDKGGVLARLDTYLRSVGCNRRLIGLAKGVSDEFITNAIYNAPVDDDDKPKYATTARNEQVDLVVNEEVRFRYVSDGRTLGMSVQDNFGRLDRSTVLAFLRKCFMRGSDQIDDKMGGAGLGFYYMFESLNNLTINVAPRKCTEMIGLMDISGTYRNFAVRPKSINFFFLQEGVS